MDGDPPENDPKKGFPISPTPKKLDSPATANETDTPALTVQTLQSLSSSTCSTPPVDIVDSSGSSAVTRQRQHLLRQIQLLAALCVCSCALLLYMLLPATALVVLSLFISSTTSLSYLLYQSVLMEWQSIVQGNGLGEYLPESVYQQLADMSLHQWMTDSTFFLEWRHLLLYFVPGISIEQRDAYLERLAPRHRRVLQRPGLGQFFGDDFMRLLVGERRWRPRQLEATLQTSRQLFEVVDEREEESEDQQVRQRDDDSFSIELDLDLDDLNALAGDNESQQLSSRLTRFVGLVGLGRSPAQPQSDENQPRPVEETPRASPGPPDDTVRGDLDDEGNIMTEAYTAMVVSYGSMVASMATGVAGRSVEAFSTFIVGTGVGLTSISIAVGTIGTMLGVYHPSRVTVPSPRFPSTRFLWSTALFGGTSAAVMLVVRGVVRRSMRTSTVEKDARDDDVNESTHS